MISAPGTDIWDVSISGSGCHNEKKHEYSHMKDHDLDRRMQKTKEKKASQASKKHEEAQMENREPERRRQKTVKKASQARNIPAESQKKLEQESQMDDRELDRKRQKTVEEKASQTRNIPAEFSINLSKNLRWRIMKLTGKGRKLRRRKHHKLGRNQLDVRRKPSNLGRKE